ncbi:winged helix-turn-helix domain-containing protein [Pseudohoeflea coraliihabitans]|uniref:Winged helix-turn-helix domain-containing protein n=1 Tax=Pseudohoeflea coraliihabitans TaxID=2860393 RepID=A0ABS6WLX2_9HYPH|nr:winged helix-turn-helix domain-containing protein [Pseudohoeflea sp. DP4N28-3]MBW3096951.1 winged helix-turn-helix domain-containing protein [Pseudohoeflea sp. DP4N28-3]
MSIALSNELARRIFMTRQGLCAAPGQALTKAGLLDLITDIGFVQVDSIATVARAHDQILFSRNQTFRRAHLRQLLEQDRALFEHWTHDASILPTAFYPYWKHYFRRREAQIRKRWGKWRGNGYDRAFAETYRRVAEGGPVMARQLKAEAHQDHRSGGWWHWHPSKTALEFFWHTGRLAVAGRENFQKIYDLAERVIPDAQRQREVSHSEFIDWSCRAALERLGFATPGEIAAFWNLVTPQEAKAWASENAQDLKDVLVETVDGRGRASLAFKDLSCDLGDWPEPPRRLRVLSPFDPLLRDRKRAERLFGFSYRIEIFVPEAQRRYGYYVFPLLEGDRLVGRIDMKAERASGTLAVRRLWLEPGVRAATGRLDRLQAELVRIARFAGVKSVSYAPDWRET